MPKFSVFTPTHDPQFLGRLAASLTAQTCQDFEWIILPNGDCRLDGPPIKQARIMASAPESRNIGALKAACCGAAVGDILVEVDHDDELTADCLDEIGKAFHEPGVDFVYSNFAEVKNGHPSAYQANGWATRTFNYEGREYVEMIAFAPEPAAIAKVWYAPNHVRAWRREFYLRIGGHDPARAVLDDQDLVCRTYIAGRMKHIDQCLYIYHNHGANTCKGERMQEIQNGTLELHDRYIYQLAERWSELSKLRKVDLCGGFNCPKGYESVDLDGADITADLNERWPFRDGEVGVFRAHDALEHLRDPIHTMREAYRCLAPRGWLLTQTPSTDGRGAWQDPTHVSFWNSNSFWYYTKRDQSRFIGTPVRFQCARLKNFFPSKHEEFHNIVYVKADLHKFAGRTSGRVEI